MTSERKARFVYEVLEQDRCIFDYPAGYRVSIVRPFVDIEIDTINIDDRIARGLFLDICVKVVPNRTLDFYKEKLGEEIADKEFKGVLWQWQDTVQYEAKNLQLVRLTSGKGFVIANPTDLTQQVIDKQRQSVANKSFGLGFMACNLGAGIGTFENTYWAQRAIEVVGPHLLGREINLGPAVPFVEEL